MVATPVAAFAATPKPPVPLHRYVPAYVRALDRASQEYGLEYGLAGYWQARLITLLSETSLRAYAVDGSFNPFMIVSNAHWYAQSMENHEERPCFSFVVLDDPLFKLSTDNLIPRFGEPEEVLDIEGVRVAVYRAQRDGVVQPRCLEY